VDPTLWRRQVFEEAEKADGGAEGSAAVKKDGDYQGEGGNFFFKTGETQWVDPAAEANTSFELSWWAWILVLYPTTLLLNDFLHFLPEDMNIRLK